MNKVRKARIESTMKKEIAMMLLTEMKDKRIQFVTVTEVSLTDDYKTAHVYVSVMGGDSEKRDAFAALKHASGFIRHEIGARIRLRYNPEIKFEIDDSIDRHARVDRLLKAIEKEKEQKKEEAAEPQEEEKND
ncbi:MAG: 30S ribosome-binding factor RbfA [Spirochaetia bacterium]|nr:30S ribosome-binding factor RbfA [Spirochaetia bacterium]